jgi:DNA-binding IclR family transcriptional regulator
MTAVSSRPSPQTERLVAIVDMLVGSRGGLTQSDIARRLGVSPATCYPMLASLERSGWLRRHPVRRTYALGAALIAAGQAAAEDMDALAACRPRMLDLQRRRGLSCVALTPSADYATVVQLAPDPRGRGSALRVGDQIPFHPPLGATYMAWQPDVTVDRWLARGGVTSAAARQDYRRVLAFIRCRGFSVELALSPDDRMRSELANLVRSRLEQGPDRDGVRTKNDGQLHPLLLELAEGLASATDLIPASLDPDRDYRLDSVSAPVFDLDGRPILVIALRGFSGETPGADIEEIGAQLTAMTMAVTAETGGRVPGS